MSENSQDQQNQPGQTKQSRTEGRWWDHIQSLLPQLATWSAIGTIGILGIGIVILLVGGLFGKNPIVRELASVDYARGVITFIFAVGTIGIALLLTLGALLGSHTQEVFAKAKEILTVLIGVFGTILGFYFGTSSGEGAHKLSISPPTIEASADGKTYTILAYVSGGDSPFVYNINFDRDGPPSIKAKTSADGWIREVIDSTKIGTSPIGYTISITDAQKRAIEHEASENERITGKAPSQ